MRIVQRFGGTDRNETVCTGLVPTVVTDPASNRRYFEHYSRVYETPTQFWPHAVYNSLVIKPQFTLLQDTPESLPACWRSYAGRYTGLQYSWRDIHFAADLNRDRRHCPCCRRRSWCSRWADFGGRSAGVGYPCACWLYSRLVCLCSTVAAVVLPPVRLQIRLHRLPTRLP
jgi:hypothetical protein